MKGPKARYRFRVRRTWKCPACQRVKQTAGHIVSLPCSCLAAADRTVWMLLVEEPRLHRPVPASLENPP